MAPGQPARNDYEYRRCGTCNVFTEPLAGKRMTKVTERMIDWAQFLADIAGRYQDATTITLMMDNLNTPRRPLRGLPAEHGSWLNVVELNVMIRQCLNRRIDCIEVLRREVAAWQATAFRPRWIGSSPPTMPA